MLCENKSHFSCINSLEISMGIQKEPITDIDKTDSDPLIGGLLEKELRISLLTELESQKSCV